MTRYLSTLALALAAAGLMATHAKAEKVIVYREGQMVKPHDVAAVLGKTRGIALLDDAPDAPKAMHTSMAAPAAAPVEKTAEKTAGKADKTATRAPAEKLAARTPAPAARDDSEAPAALSLPVRFAFDSAEILPAARTQLDALAEGIKMLAPKSTVTVEGHTDAVGADAYNLELSRARARAVRDYLVQRHGIESARLRTVGYGEDRPLDAADPYAAMNRRVQFRGS